MKDGFKIFYIMGKSSSGKDTVYKRLLEIFSGRLFSIASYTTRPIRSTEKDGSDYRFTDDEGYRRLKASGRVIEERTYDTVHGLWRYFTVCDDQFDRDGEGALMVGTPESFCSLKKYFGDGVVIPLYLELDDGVRLKRALEREMSLEKPRYKELCRRFLSDSEDFSEEKLSLAGIDRRFDNSDLEKCVESCAGEIEKTLSGT